MAVTLTSINELFEEHFAEMFKKHEAATTTIITANHKIMNDRINKISLKIV